MSGEKNQSGAAVGAESPGAGNAEVVPEKYSSARDRAQAGYHAGRFCVEDSRSATSAEPWVRSGFILEDPPQVGFHDLRRLGEVVDQAVDELELTDRLLGVVHAGRDRVDFAADEVRVLPIDGHLAERLDLALEPIELDVDKLGVL